jgi:signal transduction histidine kinase
LNEEYALAGSHQRVALNIAGTRVSVKPEQLSVIMVIRDITEQKRAEAELRQAHDRLRETQARLTQSEKLVALGQFAVGLAHEVKNPLHVISVAVDLLATSNSPNPQESAELFPTIKHAVKQADTIIRSLLEFARPASLQLKAENLNHVIEEALGFLRTPLHVNGVTVTRSFATELPAVLIDTEQMQQALVNVILNAVQAMPKGGELTVRTSVKTLTRVGHGVGRRAMDRFKLGERVLVCEVEDTGIGIPPDSLSKVFDPFFTTKSPEGGTGLGLSITRTIVEVHLGMIEIHSKEGKGTTVVMTLPLAETG